jgi:hypothetical protein
MRRKILKEIPVLSMADLPASCSGFSLFMGVLILWDGDEDERLLGFVSDMGEESRADLLAVHEHKGALYLYWRNRLPPGYAEGANLDVDMGGCGDVWFVAESTSPEGCT